MASEAWTTHVTDRVIECAGPHPEVMLRLLCDHLEAHGTAASAIACAIDEMANWYEAQTAGLVGLIELRRIVREASNDE